MTEPWQEWECAGCGGDFDLHGAARRFGGELVHCVHCGHEFPASDAFVNCHNAEGEIEPLAVKHPPRSYDDQAWDIVTAHPRLLLVDGKADLAAAISKALEAAEAKGRASIQSSPTP